MIPTLHIQKTDIRQIDFDDYTYSLSPLTKNRPDQSIRASINRVGILHPPVIKEKAADLYIIVAGRQRLMAARQMFTHNSYDCFLLPQDMSKRDTFAILLEEILSTRPLASLEQAVFLQKIGSFLDEAQIISDILPRLGLSRHAHHIHQALRLLELEEPLLTGIELGILDERVARDMTELSCRDRLAVYEIIELLNLSTSNQKKFLILCRDIGARTSQKIADLLGDVEFKHIINHREANPPQKTANIMSWLKNKKSPRYSEAEKKFNRLISSLELPKNIRIAHTPFFENDLTTLSIHFKNLQQFMDKWQKIKKVLDNEKN